MRALLWMPALALLAGCATTGAKTPGDPYEGFNRAMWGFDQTLDKAVMKPVAKGYIAAVPSPVRQGLHNALQNVTEPFSFINAILQGKPKRALNTLGRFVINSTVGIGGLFDVAGKNGYKPAPEDLGQTFAVWGAKKSSYLVLPFFGPSTIRDGIGTLGAQWADPYRILIRKELSFWPAAGLTAFEFVDARANLIDTGADTLLETSADPYAVVRSAYLQHRQAEIEDRDEGGAGAGGDNAALNAALDELGPDEEDNGAANAAAPERPGAQPEQEPQPGDEARPTTSRPEAAQPAAPETPRPASQPPRDQNGSPQ
ncbi:MAG TPA: MlaA family lipoprotein [Sphingomonas sp.]|nr:MlaA family lipoprotein [Sphingomonas sp.]